MKQDYRTWPSHRLFEELDYMDLLLASNPLNMTAIKTWSLINNILDDRILNETR